MAVGIEHRASSIEHRASSIELANDLLQVAAHQPSERQFSTPFFSFALHAGEGGYRPMRTSGAT
jgi:hypothetical protein